MILGRTGKLSDAFSICSWVSFDSDCCSAAWSQVTWAFTEAPRRINVFARHKVNLQFVILVNLLIWLILFLLDAGLNGKQFANKLV